MSGKALKFIALFFILFLIGSIIFLSSKFTIFGNLQGVLTNDSLESLIVNNIRNSGGTIGFIVLLIAGMIDGINPCALSMLFFFLIFVISIKDRKSNVLLVGILFAAGSFLSYFLAGLGLLKIIYYARYVKYLNIVLFALASLLAFVFAYFNIADAINAKLDNLKDIKLKLPSKNKEFIHNLIRKIALFKFRYLVAFLLGFLVTLSELLCTGQIYLVTLMSVNMELGIIKILHLVVFNIGFIIPILILSFLVYKGREVMSMSEVVLDNMWIIKLITAVIMLVLGSYTLLNFLSVI
ncbi:cytochrome c biogenesis CcdA family protein [Candidatus Clostridium radicumherbarum]|uniref:Cytochrome c biogenesis CcdA family protein n=1 Tax=Candidatus Clostridium radicumherbarum TaxID=3381662 RepID=A0ABW8TSD2_9CLOT